MQKHPRGMRNPQIVNASQQNVDIQPRVEGHLKDVGHPEPSMSVHTILVLGHRNTLIQLLREITKDQKVLMRYPLIILIQENHTIERLQLLTFISPLELQKALIWIENLSPWQSA